jgi:hypothetical protein
MFVKFTHIQRAQCPDHLKRSQVFNEKDNEVLYHAFLNSTMKDELSVSRPGRSTSEE